MAQLLTCPVPTKSFPGFCPQGVALLRAPRSKRSLPANRELYEQKITTPLLNMVCSITREFARFARHYVTPPAKAVFDVSGNIGSSRTAAPSWTHPAAIWVHKDAVETQGACFYFHFTAREAVVLGGVYSAGPDEVKAYRKLIEKDYREFQEILRNPRLKKLAGELQGEPLQHMPKGFPAHHPAADLVRRKQWYLVSMLDMDLISTTQLMPAVVSRFEAMAPFVEFFNRTLPRRSAAKKTR
ncbi:MAG TPA: DUF2461 family protein [Candidatus Angelobacter sp.]